jgi:aryl-alcohol dehydrogenase-like predicted oxidoreductase
VLGGVLKKVAGGRRTSEEAQRVVERHRPQLEAYEALCARIGESPAAVALAWMLHNPVVTGPIIGPRTVEQLGPGLRALELRLTDGLLQELDRIWPGPGGEAPEAYAW